MSKKYASNVDKNQPEIVKAFRDRGCYVAHTHNAGAGFPDIVVGCNGVTVLVEIKSKGGKLNEKQRAFFEVFTGACEVVYNEADVERVFNVYFSKDVNNQGV